MGGANSKIDFGRLTRPSTISSGKELVASTKEVRDMADSLFRFMYNEFGEKEVMDMAMDPDKYVIALSDLIETKFEVLGYITKNNQMGELYFAKYKDLNPVVSNPDITSVEKEKLQKNQRENSMMIAFYYVRLFQILGSLLIVIKDLKFEIPVEGANPINLVSREPVGYLGRPLFEQRIRNPRFDYPQPGINPQIGGSVRNQALGAYEFLRLYMDKVPEGDAIRPILQIKQNTILFKITPNLYFEFNPTDQQINRGTTKQRFLLRTKSNEGPTIQNYDSTILHISPNLPAFKALEDFTRIDDINKYIPISVIIGIKTQGKAGSTKLPYPITFDRADIYQTDIEELKRGAKYKISDASREPGSGSFVSSARTLTRADSSGTRNIGEIFENALVAYSASLSTDTGLRLFTSTDRDSQSREVSQRKIGQLKDKLENNLLDEIYQLMKKGTQPKTGQQIVPFQSHCISRALQLLDTKSISELIPQSPKTDICKFSIGEKTVPTIGQYEPIKSLAQLYGKINIVDFKKSERVLQAFVRYRDTAGESIPKGPLSMSNLKGIDQKNEVNDLQSAIDRLNKAFNYLETKLEVVDGIMTIPVKRPKECKTSETIEVGSQPTALAMQSYAQQLMAFHVNQTIEISKFLQSIFDVKKDKGTGRWIVKGPSENYMFAGFPVLDQLTNQARELLVDYYSGCETLYQKGVKAWIDSQPKSTNTKANVAAAL